MRKDHCFIFLKLQKKCNECFFIEFFLINLVNVSIMRKNSIDTIFALSTFYGPSAIAIIRISGPGSLKIAKKLCKIKILKARFAHLLNIYDLQSNLIDKALVIYFKSPIGIHEKTFHFSV